jgi:hypothetical protein
MRHLSMFGSAGAGSAAAWNRELLDELNGTVQAHIGAMNRKHALRDQQLTFSVAGRSPYMRPTPAMRRLPC